MAFKPKQGNGHAKAMNKDSLPSCSPTVVTPGSRQIGTRRSESASLIQHVVMRSRLDGLPPHPQPPPLERLLPVLPFSEPPCPSLCVAACVQLFQCHNFEDRQQVHSGLTTDAKRQIAQPNCSGGSSSRSVISAMITRPCFHGLSAKTPPPQYHILTDSSAPSSSSLTLSTSTVSVPAPVLSWPLVYAISRMYLTSARTTTPPLPSSSADCVWWRTGRHRPHCVYRVGYLGLD
jgi:hypothetical protein